MKLKKYVKCRRFTRHRYPYSRLPQRIFSVARAPLTTRTAPQPAARSTRPKCYLNIVLNKPISAPAAISQVEFILNRISITSEAAATTIVSASVSDALPNCHVTAAINASEAALTPSNNPLNHIDFRIRGIHGFEIATNMNEGRKIPAVARSAPRTPPRTKPMNVAVVNTGPGVT